MRDTDRIHLIVWVKDAEPPGDVVDADRSYAYPPPHLGLRTGGSLSAWLAAQKAEGRGWAAAPQKPAGYVPDGLDGYTEYYLSGERGWVFPT